MHDKLSPDTLANTSPAMMEVLMTSLARLAKEDIQAAIDRNSVYRELGAYQWARAAAQRAREFYPWLRDEES